MKQVLSTLFFLAFICVSPILARNPVGYYKVKYVAYNNNGKTDVAVSERTLRVDETRLTVLNTPQGLKYWEVNYQGKVNLSRFNNFTFHKYYLVNKHVYCYISDDRVIEGKDGRIYYLIEFDGQVQLADFEG